MADTAITTTTLSISAATANPAGTAIVHANTHVITPAGPTDKLLIRVTNTTASEKVATLVAGDSPPADAAGQGAITLTLAAGDTTPTVGWFGPIDSSRFIQSDGTVHVTVAASTTGNIAAFQLP